jgi:hypothetical protein
MWMDDIGKVECQGPGGKSAHDGIYDFLQGNEDHKCYPWEPEDCRPHSPIYPDSHAQPIKTEETLLLTAFGKLGNKKCARRPGKDKYFLYREQGLDRVGLHCILWIIILIFKTGKMTDSTSHKPKSSSISSYQNQLVGLLRHNSLTPPQCFCLSRSRVRGLVFAYQRSSLGSANAAGQGTTWEPNLWAWYHLVSLLEGCSLITMCLQRLRWVLTFVNPFHTECKKCSDLVYFLGYMPQP